MKNQTITALEMYLDRIDRLYLEGGGKKPRKPSNKDSNFLAEILKGQKKRNNYLLILAGSSLLIIFIVALWVILYTEGNLIDILLSITVEVFFFLLGLWVGTIVKRNEAKQVIIQEMVRLEPEEAAVFIEWLYKFMKKRP